MKTTKVNTICHVRAFEGYPLTRCTLKGRTWSSYSDCWLYVIKPLETSHGYIKGQLDTCRHVIPASCKRWLQGGLKFAPKPYRAPFDALPVINLY